MKSKKKVGFSRLKLKRKQNRKKRVKIWWRKKFDFSRLDSTSGEKGEFSRLQSIFSKG